MRPYTKLTVLGHTIRTRRNPQIHLKRPLIGCVHRILFSMIFAVSRHPRLRVKPILSNLLKHVNKNVHKNLLSLKRPEIRHLTRVRHHHHPPVNAAGLYIFRFLNIFRTGTNKLHSGEKP